MDILCDLIFDVLLEDFPTHEAQSKLLELLNVPLGMDPEQTPVAKQRRSQTLKAMLNGG